MTRLFTIIRGIQIGSGVGQRVVQSLIAAAVPFLLGIASLFVILLLAWILGWDTAGDPRYETRGGRVYEVTDPADWFVAVLIPSMLLMFIGPFIMGAWFWLKSRRIQG